MRYFTTTLPCRLRCFCFALCFVDSPQRCAVLSRSRSVVSSVVRVSHTHYHQSRAVEIRRLPRLQFVGPPHPPRSRCAVVGRANVACAPDTMSSVVPTGPPVTAGPAVVAVSAEPKDSKWFMSLEQVQNSPSRREGIPSDQELNLRQKAAYLIQEMGQKLRVYPFDKSKLFFFFFIALKLVSHFPHRPHCVFFNLSLGTTISYIPAAFCWFLCTIRMPSLADVLP